MCFFFFKQKAAYEMRISDWSSDVCSSDLARLRAHRGVTLDLAREIMGVVSYFGTMMVHLGEADGMVSGAAHTTAHTITPSFEIIKTEPGTSIVSSVFFMCLADRVLVYGDCAVVPDPTAEQLADIAISRSEEHTSELQSLMRISYAVFCLKKKQPTNEQTP